MTARLCIAVLALLGIYGMAESLKGRGMPTEIADPKMQIQELPRQFGSWTSEDRTLDPEVFKAIGAQGVIDRVYRDKNGNIATLHGAVFLKYGVQGVPHSPEICYPAAGFSFNDAKIVYLDPDGKPAHPARLLTFEKDGQQTYCLYWYQFGDTTYCDGYVQRQLILALRGQTVWPPLVKVMLQTTAAGPAEAERLLKELAAPVLAWTKGFH